MLQPVFDFIEKFATDFNWKRVVIIVSIIFITVVCFYLYEDLTATYELKKYERTVAILQDLESLDKSTKDQEKVIDNILAGLGQVTREGSSGFQVPIFKNESLKLALFASAPWLLFTLAFVPSWARGDAESRNVVIGSLAFSIFVGVGGYLIPETWPSWVRFFGYGVVGNIILGVFLAIKGNESK